jgi:hypothetical protein
VNEEENRSGVRLAVLLLVLIWTALIAGVLPYCAHAATQVYLEDEQDLGNGYKLCIYSEGVTITVQSYRLCPLSINAGDDE